MKALLLAGVLAAVGCSEDTGERSGREIEYWPIPVVGRETPLPPALDAGAASDAGGMRTSDAAVGAGDAAPAVEPDPTLELFDPEAVYLLGTLSEGSCAADAVAKIAAPNDGIAGFSCDVKPYLPRIRPSDGRLLYLDFLAGRVRVFHCDGCVYSRSGLGYPEHPEQNDDVLTAPMCTGLRDFLIAPDGSLAYFCDEHVYDDAGRELPDDVVTLGHRGTALTPDAVIELGSGERHAIEDLPDRAPLTRRAHRTGYWLLLPGKEAESPPELWRVDFEGQATRLGVYPSIPAGQTEAGLPILDGDGKAYQFGRHAEFPYNDTILSRTIDGLSEVAYDEEDEPVVRVHISELFTGP